MKVIEPSNMQLVQAGLSWPHAKQPTSRDMLPMLERQEMYVTWLQPKGGGVDEQLATIKVGDNYCALSLRLQKALFRHIRLQTGFVNREKTPDGTLKLRIPQTLFLDKKKTAMRFTVRLLIFMYCLCM